MQVSSSIPVTDHEDEVVTVDENNTPVLYLREEKWRLEMEVKNKETKMEALKKEIEKKEKKKEEEEKKMKEMKIEVIEAHARKAPLDKKIIRLQLQLQKSHDNAPASPSNGDKPRRQKYEIEADIKTVESKTTQYLVTIEEYARMESNWAILNQDIIRLKQEYDSLNKEWAKASSDLFALLANHPYLLSDASKEPGTGTEKKSEVCVTIVSCMCSCSFKM